MPQEREGGRGGSPVWLFPVTYWNVRGLGGVLGRQRVCAASGWGESVCAPNEETPAGALGEKRGLQLIKGS